MSVYGYELAEHLYSNYGDYGVRMFSKKDKKHSKKKVDLSEVDSHRGLGRAAAIGLLAPAPFTLPGSLAGGYIGKKYADELDEDGDYRDERGSRRLVRKAGHMGALSGAAIGGGLALAATGGKSVVAPLIAAGASALGGGLGARKNVRERVNKRALREAGVVQLD